jgi:UDP-glucuronate 4-epimerase
MENFAKVYSNKYNIPITALRIFTVFGEYGRPDMSILKFANKIKNEEPINLYNFGENKRDFIYVEDFKEITFRLMNNTPKPFEIFNIGSGNSYKIKDIVNTIEKILNKKAILNLLEKNIGDVESTKANNQKMISASKFNNFSNFEKSIEKTLKWFENI